MYSLYERLKAKPDTVHDDIKILKSYVEYREGKDVMDYMIYELEIKDRDGTPMHLYKAVKMYRIIRIPDSAKDSLKLMDIHKQILASFWESKIKYISIISRIDQTGDDAAIGLLQLYGVQGVARTLEEAKRIANADFSGLTSALQGSYRTMEFRLLNTKETHWLREKMLNMKHVQVVRGIPLAKKSAAERGARGFGGSDTSPGSEETSEQFASALSNHEFVAMTLSSPIDYEVLEKSLADTSKRQTYWNSVLQGSVGMSAGINIPIMFAANLGSSLGMSDGTSDSTSEGTSKSYSKSYSESFSESLSTSQSVSTGVSTGVSSGISTGVSENFGESSGISHNEGTSFGTSSSIGTSESVSMSQSSSTSNSVSNSQSVSNSVSNSLSNSTSNSLSESWSQGASQSHGTSSSIGSSSSNSISVGNSQSASSGTSNSVTNSSSAGQSSSSGLNASFMGVGGSGSVSNTASNSVGTSQGVTQGSSVSNSVSNSNTVGSSTSSGVSNSWGSSFSQGGGSSVSQSTSTSTGTSTGFSESASVSQSQSTSVGTGQSFGVSQSQGTSQGVSSSDGWSKGISYGQGRTFGQSQSTSTTQSQSQSMSTSTGTSKGVSEGISEGEGTSWGRSIGKSSSVSNSTSQGLSTSMGMGASLGISKSYQFIDAEVQNIIELLEFQRLRFKEAIHGRTGAFFTDMYIATETEEAKYAARTAAKFAWYDDQAMICPLQVLEVDEEENKHLLYHMNAFSACTKKEMDVYGTLESYKYSTILTSDELVAYTHVIRLSDGGIYADIQNIPELAVPSEMKGEVYIGKVLNGYRWNIETGYKTPFDYRIGNDALMHALICGGSRSGKTVGALRFVAEAANYIKRGPQKKRLRIIAMDPKEDWRKLAKFVEPERFRIYSMGDPKQFPFKLNPLKVPHLVDPEFHLDMFIDVFCRSYGLGIRSVTILLDTLKTMYDKAGVFDTEDPIEITQRSSTVTIAEVFKLLNAKKENKEFGRDKSDAVDKVLDRLGRFAWENGVLYKLYCQPDGMSIDEILGEDDVVVLESGKLQSNSMAFIFGFITASIYAYSKYHPENFLHEDQYETVLVVEEANRVLSGDGGNSESGIQGQSIFEEMLDQAAGLGLFVVSITQQPNLMPKSIIANSGILFAGRMTIPDDIDIMMSAMGKEGRLDDRPIKKFFPKCPTGWFMCKTSRTFDYKESEPVMVAVDRLDVEKPSNEELFNAMKLQQLKAQNEQLYQVSREVLESIKKDNKEELIKEDNEYSTNEYINPYLNNMTSSINNLNNNYNNNYDMNNNIENNMNTINYNNYYNNYYNNMNNNYNNTNYYQNSIEDDGNPSLNPYKNGLIQ